MWRWLACVAPGPYGEHPPGLDIPPPTIDAFSVDCNVDDGVWRLAATATSWTGGGVALWSEDLVYVERHVVTVAESEPDAAGESLLLALAIVSDWRAQAANVSTVFTCADVPNVSFTLYDVDGQPADCRLVGPDAEALASLPDADPSCVD
jgi:hypothetical protein